MSAECWTVLNGGDRTIWSMRKDETQRRQRGELEIQPFGDCSEIQRMRKRN